MIVFELHGVDGLLACLTWDASTGLTQSFVAESVKEDFDRFCDDGLVELIPSENDTPWLNHRITPPSSPDFLWRLGNYIRRQFNLLQVIVREVP